MTSAERSRRYRERHREKIRARARELYRANPEKHRERTRKYNEKRPHKKREMKLRAEYGMTLADYAALFKQQNGRCLLCNEPEIQKDRRTGQPRLLAVDHCHRTGKNRGLLCARCNTGIGSLRDDPALLRRAAYYIEERSKEDWQLNSLTPR